MKKILSVTLLVLFMAVSTFAGVEWVSKITTSAEKGKDSEMTSHVYAQDGDVKQVFKNVSKDRRNVYIEDGYWLYKGKEDMIYLVNDKEKTVTPLSLDALLQMTAVVGELVKIQISDHQVNTETLNPETIMGYPCSHVRITSDYTMKMKIAFIKKTFQVHEVKEIWASANVKYLNEISQAFLNKDFKTGFEELDKMIEKEMAQMKKMGFPLKTVTHNIQKGKKGKVLSDTTTTMEVLEINSKSFPAAFFEIPKDYQMADSTMASDEGEESGGKKKKKFGIF
jgi:hypothetical protein